MAKKNRFKLFEENGWASQEEFQSGLTAFSWNENVQASGIPLAVNREEIITDATDSHTLIYGNSGSKKTRNFIIPNVYALGQAQESIIIADPKGEIYEHTSGYLAEKGYNLIVLNFRDMDYSAGWNPLAVPAYFYQNGDKDRGIEMIRDLSGLLLDNIHCDNDVYWENNVRGMFEGLVLILFEKMKSYEDVNIDNVMMLRRKINYIGRMDEKSKEYQEYMDFLRMITEFPKDSMVTKKLSGLCSVLNAEKTLSGVLSVFDTMMEAFVIQEKLTDLLNRSSFDYDEIYNKNTAVYMIVPDEKQTYNFFVSLFVKQCYEYLIYAAQKMEDKKLPRRVNFIWDEFCNFTKVRDMSAMITAARSRNMRFTLVVQSKQQLSELYDKDADTIRANCRNWIFLSSREIDLLEEISKICGNVNVQGVNRPLLSISDLQRLNIGWEESQALILRAQVRPYLTIVKDFSLYPQAKYKEVPLESRKDTGKTFLDEMLGR